MSASGCVFFSDGLIWVVPGRSAIWKAHSMEQQHMSSISVHLSDSSGHPVDSDANDTPLEFDLAIPRCFFNWDLSKEDQHWLDRRLHLGLFHINDAVHSAYPVWQYPIHKEKGLGAFDYIIATHAPPLKLGEKYEFRFFCEPDSNRVVRAANRLGAWGKSFIWERKVWAKSRTLHVTSEAFRLRTELSELRARQKEGMHKKKQNEVQIKSLQEAVANENALNAKRTQSILDLEEALKVAQAEEKTQMERARREHAKRKPSSADDSPTPSKKSKQVPKNDASDEASLMKND